MLRTKNTIIGKISTMGNYCDTPHSFKIQENTNGPKGKISSSIDQILHFKLKLETSNSVGNGKSTIINTTFEPANQINYFFAQSSPKHSRFQIPTQQIINSETSNLISSAGGANSTCNLTLVPTLLARVTDNTLSKPEKKQHSIFIFIPKALTALIYSLKTFSKTIHNTNTNLVSVTMKTGLFILNFYTPLH